MTKVGFDGVAQGYDQTFTETETGTRQRRQVRAYLAPILQQPRHILELNCGTGADARWFANQGHTVYATDISAQMIQVAAQKAALSPKLQFQQADIHQALSQASGTYDLIFSNFGGFNCLSPQALGELGPLISSALAPQGHFIAIIMPRFCTWETLYFLAKLKPSQAFRRATSKAISAPLAIGHIQPTWYYNPQHLRKALGPQLQLQARRPIGSFLPPSYLDPFFASRPKLLAHMDQLEQKTANWSLLAPISDHYLIDFTRTAPAQ
ncbi:MAG TPA: class I SAM-dependent methyltransferase [Bacteroidetes bacterium]|nr:class I SAM-dependent methyltransferase [Bacteroidota bacterium]